MEWYKMILIPLVSMLIGWFTNYIAVYLLFKPENPVSILGLFKIQGIFPKRQSLLATRIGRMVADELLSFDDLKKTIQSPESLSVIIDHISKKINDYFERLMNDYRWAGALVGSKTRDKIKRSLLDEIEQLLPQTIALYASNLEKKIKIDEIVAEKVKNLKSAELSRMLNNVLQKEFRFIEILGAIIGLIIGLTQVIFVLFA